MPPRPRESLHLRIVQDIDQPRLVAIAATLHDVEVVVKVQRAG